MSATSYVAQASQMYLCSSATGVPPFNWTGWMTCFGPSISVQEPISTHSSSPWKKHAQMLRWCAANSGADGLTTGDANTKCVTPKQWYLVWKTCWTATFLSLFIWLMEVLPSGIGEAPTALRILPCAVLTTTTLLSAKPDGPLRSTTNCAKCWCNMPTRHKWYPTFHKLIRW